VYYIHYITHCIKIFDVLATWGEIGLELHTPKKTTRTMQVARQAQKSTRQENPTKKHQMVLSLFCI
jgi:hypothetical protein